MIHRLAWTSWTGGVLIILSVTRNPFYLMLTLACVAVVNIMLQYESWTAAAPISPLRFGQVVIPLSALFNALTVRVGRTVLLHIPDWLPLFGGNITLEALSYGALNGMVLTGIFAAFIVLNRALPVRSLVRLIPRAFYQVAVVVSIALTYLPITLRQFHQIREAQAIRGHRTQGLRDWLPLFIPLLVGGLERALQLAEAMIARGFASSGEKTHDTLTRLVIAQGLVALLIGWLLRLVWAQRILGLALMLAGLGLVLAALWVVGQRASHTDYRPERWSNRDWVVVLGIAVAVAPFLLPLPGLQRASIYYYPYPLLNAPGFNLIIGGAILGLLAPALVLQSQSTTADYGWSDTMPER
ncbi:MAG: energy-coupling factor transporter transmembrane component T [Anaerolineae bacterium]